MTDFKLNEAKSHFSFLTAKLGDIISNLWLSNYVFFLLKLLLITLICWLFQLPNRTLGNQRHVKIVECDFFLKRKLDFLFQCWNATRRPPLHCFQMMIPLQCFLPHLCQSKRRHFAKESKINLFKRATQWSKLICIFCIDICTSLN